MFCLDDIIVYSVYFDQHLERLEYLGHGISKGGTKTDSETIATVQDWHVPQNVKDVICLDSTESMSRIIARLLGCCIPCRNVY